MRRNRHGRLWLPEGFRTSGKIRHEAVREDHVELQLRKKQLDILPNRQGGDLPTDDKCFTFDEGAVLDDDHRQWTRQHLKAADLRVPGGVDGDTVDVNVRGPDGFTPLMIASCSGGGLETAAVGEEDVSAGVVDNFIFRGASLHERTERSGETALHLAARYARSDAAKSLLEAGADANARDNAGRTPLHAALAADAQGVFQILIRNRATDLDARMYDGTTPLILASRLAVEGTVDELINSHADVNAVDDFGKSALHWAAAVNNMEATIVLLKSGANKDMQNNKVTHLCPQNIKKEVRLDSSVILSPTNSSLPRLHHMPAGWLSGMMGALCPRPPPMTAYGGTWMAASYFHAADHHFLTPSPGSPDCWSSCSPHSNVSDWSEGISSPPASVMGGTLARAL
ncbi:neurogenic locus notch homolog protein 1-like isoform X2 [Stigmatopora argus]